MIKLGILGGGQLGRMLLQQAVNLPIETWILENDPFCPAAHLCHHFVEGNINSFEQVMAFGQLVDVITIEIEQVNVDALFELEKLGKKVIPSAQAIYTIQSKVRQKQFYQLHGLPTPEFVISENLAHLKGLPLAYPVVQKLAQGGYDGKGVQVLRSENELEQAFDAPSVIEKAVSIDHEIAVLVARSQVGEMVMYDPVQMVFDPTLNLLNYQVCPAKITEQQRWKIEAIAFKTVKQLNSPGIFAVELFIDKAGEVWINEMAPRVHNSGHHTIEATTCSQFEMLLRILCNYPLGNTESLSASALVNLVGQAGSQGEAIYEGLSEIMAMERVFVHLYGKKESKPGRKMGHVTVLGKDVLDVMRKARIIKDQLIVRGNPT